MNDPISKPAASAPLIVRHSGYVRFLHWTMAVAYIVAMATGMGLYWRRLLGWMLPFFGGKDFAVDVHFWVGLALTLITLLLFIAWRKVAQWSAADSNFVRHLGSHALHPGQPQPEDTGFFNGGQKLYFWGVVVTGVIFFGTGLVWWFRKDVPNEVYAVCRTTHRILGVLMSAALLVHVYKATIGEPGTLRSMLRGTVTLDWARRRRPKWFREIDR
jgi:formate dehydrogenase subunit gamma